MGIIAEPLTENPSKKRNLVEMSWDPRPQHRGAAWAFSPKLILKTSKWRSATALHPSFADTAFS